MQWVIIMTKRTGNIRETNRDINLYRLIFLTAVMALGAAVGSIYAANASKISFHLLNVMNLYGTELFKRLILINTIPIVAVYLAGFFEYGSILTLLLAAAKGFVFSVPLTESVKNNGISGYLSFAAMGSFCGILSVFVLIIMSMQSIEMSSKHRLSIHEWRDRDEDTKNTFMMVLCCIAAIIFGAAADAYLLK